MNFRLSINIIFNKSTPAATSDDKYDFNKVSAFMGFRRLWAYSYGGGGPREGEVPHLPIVKKKLAFTCNPGTLGRGLKCYRVVSIFFTKTVFLKVLKMKSAEKRSQA